MRARIPSRRDGEASVGLLARIALAFAAWCERWFPDAYVFAALAIGVVAAAALLNGAPPSQVARAFGDGFWSLLTFTMQQVMVLVSGYIIASSPPAAGLIGAIARLPRDGRGAIAFIAVTTMLLSLVNWAISLMFGGLLVRAMARREDLAMDYRAAAAAAYLGLGATWALGLSSSAAQLQANAASLPKPLLAIGGVIPFTNTIFLWQSGLVALVLIIVATAIAYLSAPAKAHAMTAQELGVDLGSKAPLAARPERPGDFLEFSPILTVLIVSLGAGWLVREFATKNPILAISNLNTYNFALLTLGLLLHWRPRSFLDAAAKAVPATTGIIIQFPLYGGVTGIMTGAIADGGASLATHLAELFTSLCTKESFPIFVGIYSALLGFFIPSGGGKWILEAPYVLQSAVDLEVHLGWAVQVYNAAEALPNLVNPFFMLMLIGLLGLKARDIVGFTAVQLAFLAPIVLFMLWALAGTLTYHPPLVP
jgi:short-chain fatty acids transporter